ncbi:hypothetical protein ASPZODRAFT_141048 [Penicilliopsis zonata CBS 506.65]|uniref:Eisosome protein 1 n=1 Tax=Penicilliopsis zonata CBS 506.65 TaxID=1073090 RepID=A0A1L9SK74_9EURO|nr:hypothetical protein ASPZODRAFT_141048 [Penicilliopsis zonata CBS 506.65]OJJ47454.1 hypothetical protein ASPZODRAFT_141048 [Penicilliopsis zonata CBS 506.65]
MASTQPATLPSSHSLQAARLADQAATAALYVTHPERKTSAEFDTQRNSRVIGSPTPTFNQASAGAAASLAHAKSRPYEAWKPEKQPAAEKAALHVQDHQSFESAPQTAIPPSPEGLRAALCSVRDHRATPISPPPVSGAVRSAAGGEYLEGGRDRRSSTSHEGAVLAATGAFTSSRKRAESAPIRPSMLVDNSFALSAAGASHRSRPKSQMPLGDLDNLDSALEASRIHNIANANAQLYTATPPVSIEVEEQNKRDTLRAAAISMARDMYAVSEKTKDRSGADTAVYAAQRGHYRAQSQRSISKVDKSSLQRAVQLQDTAQKLAAEKLARMQDETEAYQSYYGTNLPPPRSRLSVRRRRTSSDTDADVERSKEIRNQMSSLQSKLNRLDEQRQKDRDDLMTRARRNVDAALLDIEMKVYADTGKASPAMQREWEEKARERARLEAETQLTQNGSRIHIGADQYVDRAEVEAVARSRVQPTLDELSDRAEEKRAKEFEQRLDEEERRRYEAIQRERDASVKAFEKRQRDLEKGDPKQDKTRLWRRKSKRAAPPPAETAPSETGEPAEETEPEAVRSQEVPVDNTVTMTPMTPTEEAARPSTETSPKSDSKLKAWFKDRIGRRMSGPAREVMGDAETPNNNTGDGAEAMTGFAGGAALAARADASQGREDADGGGAFAAQNPPTGNDLAQMQNGRAAAKDQQTDQQTGQESAQSPPKDRGGGGGGGEIKRSRFRASLMKIVSKGQQNEAPKSNGVPKHEGQPTGDSAPAESSALMAHDAQHASREDLRGSALEQGLPAPPVVGDRGSVSTIRESRFSEDL